MALKAQKPKAGAAQHLSSGKDPHKAPSGDWTLVQISGTSLNGATAAGKRSMDGRMYYLFKLKDQSHIAQPVDDLMQRGRR